MNLITFTIDYFFEFKEEKKWNRIALDWIKLWQRECRGVWLCIDFLCFWLSESITRENDVRVSCFFFYFFFAVFALRVAIRFFCDMKLWPASVCFGKKSRFACVALCLLWWGMRSLGGCCYWILKPYLIISTRHCTLCPLRFDFQCRFYSIFIWFTAVSLPFQNLEQFLSSFWI